MNYNLHLVEYNRIFLEKSGIWLRDDYIKYFTDTPDFTNSQQEQWFDSLQKNELRIVWGVLCNNIPIGACGLKIDSGEKRAEYWGYIGEKKLYGKGLGNRMMQLVEEQSLILGIEELYLKVLPDNERAVRLYTKRGFVKYDKDDKFIYMCKDIRSNRYLSYGNGE